jgi:CDP-diacylglycerol--glycerol-3-phosphate 3-phosphatidyltransferase
VGWPNIITGVRIALVPVVVLLILAQTDAASYAAAAVFVLGGLTDGLDGYVARRHGMTTRTGTWLDPLSDKFLVVAPVLTMTALGQFPIWAAVIIVAREAAVVALRAFRGTRGTSMPASDIAKVKTGAQLVAITLYILPLHGADTVRLVTLSVAVGITVWSGVDYFLRAPRPRAPS